MLNWVSKEFLISVVACLTIALVVLSISGPPYPNSEPPRKQGREHSDTYQQNSQYPPTAQVNCYPNCANQEPENDRDESRFSRFIDKTVDDPVASGTFCLAVVTLLLVLVVLCQVRDARKSSERQLRAYVFVDNVGITNVGEPPTPIPPGQPVPQGAIRWRDSGPIVVLQIQNSGQTPAFDVEHFGNIIFREFPLATPLPPFQGNMSHRTKISIPPGGKTTKNLVMPNPLTQVQIAGLRANTSAIYIYGTIVYVDAFKKGRFSNYRYYHNAVSGNVGVTGEVVGSDEGNDAS